LPAKRARKANEVSDGLRSALEAEKQASTAFQQQASLLSKRLESLEGLALLTAEGYKAAVEGFGGSTSALPEEASAFNLLTWLRVHVEKIPSFVGGAVDIAALASATNFAKVLMRGGCTHATEVWDEDFRDVSALGETSDSLRKCLCNFMGKFWAPFGRAVARRMAEDRRAKVAPPFELVCPPFLALLLPWSNMFDCMFLFSLFYCVF
jgi:hypothetical protein